MIVMLICLIYSLSSRLLPVSFSTIILFDLYLVLHHLFTVERCRLWVGVLIPLFQIHARPPTHPPPPHTHPPTPHTTHTTQHTTHTTHHTG